MPQQNPEKSRVDREYRILTPAENTENFSIDLPNTLWMYMN